MKNFTPQCLERIEIADDGCFRCKKCTSGHVNVILTNFMAKILDSRMVRGKGCFRDIEVVLAGDGYVPDGETAMLKKVDSQAFIDPHRFNPLILDNLLCARTMPFIRAGCWPAVVGFMLSRFAGTPELDKFRPDWK